MVSQWLFRTVSRITDVGEIQKQKIYVDCCGRLSFGVKPRKKNNPSNRRLNNDLSAHVSLTPSNPRYYRLFWRKVCAVGFYQVQKYHSCEGGYPHFTAVGLLKSCAFARLHDSGLDRLLFAHLGAPPPLRPRHWAPPLRVRRD